MTAEETLAHFAARQGWDLDSQLTLVLRYVESLQDDDDSLYDFLQRQADLENGIGQEESNESNPV